MTGTPSTTVTPTSSVSATTSSTATPSLTATPSTLPTVLFVIDADTDLPENTAGGSLIVGVTSSNCEVYEYCRWEATKENCTAALTGAIVFDNEGVDTSADLTLNVSTTNAALLDFENDTEPHSCVIGIVAFGFIGGRSVQTNQSIRVTLIDLDEAPTFSTLPPNPVRLNENTPTGTFLAQAIATDVDVQSTGDHCGLLACSYTIVSQTLPNVVSVNASDGRIFVGTSTVDFEVNTNFSCVLRAENSLSVDTTVPFQIDNLQDEAPLPFGASVSVGENTQNVLLVDLDAVDPDQSRMSVAVDCNGTCRYEIVPGAVSPPQYEDQLAINRDSGQLSLDAAELNFEVHAAITVDVNVTDLVGLWRVGTVAIAVLDEPDPTIVVPLHRMALLTSSSLNGTNMPGASFLAVDEDVDQEVLWEVIAVTPAFEGRGDPTSMRIMAPAQPVAAFTDATLARNGNDTSLFFLKVDNSTRPDPGVYDVFVRARDANANLTGEQRLWGEASSKLLVTDSNDKHFVHPFFANVSESAASGTPLGTVTVEDEDPAQSFKFTILAPWSDLFQLTPVCSPVNLPSGRTLSSAVSPHECPAGEVALSAELTLKSGTLERGGVLSATGSDVVSVPITVQDDGVLLTPELGFTEYGFQRGTPSVHTVFATLEVTILPATLPMQVSSISAVSVSTGFSTEGGEFVRITGTNLQPSLPYLPGTDPTSRLVFINVTTGLEHIGAPCIVEVSRSELKCFSPEGHGLNVSAELRVGDQTVVVPGFFFYAPPVVFSVTGEGAEAADPAGGQRVVITGLNFGKPREEYKVEFGRGFSRARLSASTFLAENCNMTIPHRQLECHLSKGTGQDLSWNVHAFDQVAEVPTSSYLPPNITSVTVFGGRFVPDNAGLVVEATNTILGLQELPFMPTTGTGGILRITGTGLGTTIGEVDFVKLGPQVGDDLSDDASKLRCIMQSDTASNSSLLMCEAAEGFGSGFKVQLRARGGLSRVFPIPLSYDAPEAKSVSVPSDEDGVLLQTKARRMLVKGENFGPLAPPKRITLFTTAAPGQGVVPPADFKANGPHNQVEVPDMPGGNGVNHSLVFSVDGREAPPLILSYQPPQLAALELVSGSLEQPPIRLRLTGQYFARCCWLQKNVSAIQPSLCRCTHQGNDSIVAVVQTDFNGVQSSAACTVHSVAEDENSLDCELQGPTSQLLEGNGALKLTVGGQFVSTPFTYLSLLEPFQLNRVLSAGVEGCSDNSISNDWSTQGGGLLCLEGRKLRYSMGVVEISDGIQPDLQGSNRTIVWRRVPGANVLHWSDGQVRVRLPAGQGSFSLRLTLPGAPNITSSSVVFGYPTPNVTRVDHPNIRTEGAWSTEMLSIRLSGKEGLLVLHGTNFGLDSTWTQDVRQLLEGAGVEGGVLSTPACRNSSVPVGCVVNQTAQHMNKVLVGGRQCAIVTWTHTRIECLVPDGAGKVPIEVFVYKKLVSVSGSVVAGGLDPYFEFTSPLSDDFSYASPRIDEIVHHGSVRGAAHARPYIVPDHFHSRTVGGDLVEIKGGSFGTGPLLAATGGSLICTINGETLGNVRPHNHTSIMFVTPAGTGFNLSLVVSVGGLQSAPAFFSYDPMVVAVMHTVGIASDFVRLAALSGVSSFSDQPAALNSRRLISAGEVDVLAVALPQEPSALHSDISFPRATALIPGRAGYSQQMSLNALGGTIALRGWNFGQRTPNTAEVTVGGEACIAGTGYTNAWQGDGLLQCVLPSMTVGRKDVHVRVGTQQFSVPVTASPVMQTCDEGFFGVIPGVDSCQECLQCGTADCSGQQAAACQGGSSIPQPAPGYWQLDMTQPLTRQWQHLSGKQEQFLRDVKASNPGINAVLQLEDLATVQNTPSASRWVMVPCDPSTACFGNNTCELGYAGTACQLCADTFYRSRDSRRIGKCDTCSASNPGAVLFATAALAAGPLSLLAYFLIKLAPSTVGITLSLQLLQIVAILVKLPMPWGVLARLLSNAGLASMLALAIIPPECSFLKWNFLQSWFAYQSIPVMLTAAGVFTGFSHWVFLLVRRVCVWKRDGPICPILPWQHALRTWFLLMDLFYVGMVSSALEVFSCKEVGGKQVLSADVEIDCFGEQYNALYISASVAVGLYAVGFPLLVSLTLLCVRNSAVRNLDVIEADRDPDEVPPRSMVTLLMASSGTSSSMQGLATKDISSQERTHIRVHAFLGRLYSPQSSEAVMWPGAMLVFRGIIVLTVAFLMQEPVLASLSAAVTLGSLSTVLALIRPFREVQLVSSFAQAARQGDLGIELMKAQQQFGTNGDVRQVAPGGSVLARVAEGSSLLAGSRRHTPLEDSDPPLETPKNPLRGQRALGKGHEHLTFSEDPRQEEIEVYSPMRRFSIDALARPAVATQASARARARSGSGNDGGSGGTGKAAASVRLLSLDETRPVVAEASTKKRRRSSMARMTGRASLIVPGRSGQPRSSVAAGSSTGPMVDLEEDETWPTVTMVWLGLTPFVARQLERDFKQHWSITRSCGRRVKFAGEVPELRPMGCCGKPPAAAAGAKPTHTLPERWARSVCTLVYVAFRLFVRHVLMLALEYNHLGALMCALLFIAIQGSLLRELTSTTMPIEEIAVTLMFSAMLWTSLVELVLAAAYWRWQLAATAVYVEGVPAVSPGSCCARFKVGSGQAGCMNSCHGSCSRVTNAIAGSSPPSSTCGAPGSLSQQNSQLSQSNPLMALKNRPPRPM